METVTSRAPNENWKINTKLKILPWPHDHDYKDSNDVGSTIFFLKIIVKYHNSNCRIKYSRSIFTCTPALNWLTNCNSASALLDNSRTDISRIINFHLLKILQISPVSNSHVNGGAWSRVNKKLRLEEHWCIVYSSCILLMFFCSSIVRAILRLIRYVASNYKIDDI